MWELRRKGSQNQTVQPAARTEYERKPERAERGGHRLFPDSSPHLGHLCMKCKVDPGVGSGEPGTCMIWARLCGRAGREEWPDSAQGVRFTDSNCCQNKPVFP